VLGELAKRKLCAIAQFVELTEDGLVHDVAIDSLGYLQQEVCDRGQPKQVGAVWCVHRPRIPADARVHSGPPASRLSFVGGPSGGQVTLTTQCPDYGRRLGLGGGV
jgi:hypothetical protein